MRAFHCPVCDQLVFFENSRCLRCGSALAFDAGERTIVAHPEHYCANASLAACNWRVAAADELCASCVLTRTRPNDADAEGLREFAEAEAAKRRLLFELGELGLWPLHGGDEAPELAFDLLSSEQKPVMTGHADGLITLDLAEADDAQRELRRQQLQEPYRTVLGHLRHEIGHFYFPVLTADDAALARAQELFGDDREDYQEALDRHYENGPPEDWQASYVSAYATMHPWEDWAESFAHVLHIRDVMQTAASYGLTVGTDPDPAAPLPTLVDQWLPLSYALNAINRSLGNEDLYPYVLTPPVIEKLSFIDERVQAHAGAA